MGHRQELCNAHLLLDEHSKQTEVLRASLLESELDLAASRQTERIHTDKQSMLLSRISSLDFQLDSTIAMCENYESQNHNLQALLQQERSSEQHAMLQAKELREELRSSRSGSMMANRSLEEMVSELRVEPDEEPHQVDDQVTAVATRSSQSMPRLIDEQIALAGGGATDRAQTAEQTAAGGVAVKDSGAKSAAENSEEAKAGGRSIMVAALKKLKEYPVAQGLQSFAHVRLVATLHERVLGRQLQPLVLENLESAIGKVMSPLGGSSHDFEFSLLHDRLLCDVDIRSNTSVVVALNVLSHALEDENDTSGLQAAVAEAGIAHAEVVPIWPFEHVQAQVQHTFGHIIPLPRLTGLSQELAALCSRCQAAWQQSQEQSPNEFYSILSLDRMVLFRDSASETKDATTELLPVSEGYSRNLREVAAKQGSSSISELVFDAAVAQQLLKQRLAPGTSWAHTVVNSSDGKAQSEASHSWLAGPQDNLQGLHYDPGIKTADEILSRARSSKKLLDIESPIASILNVSQVVMIFESSESLLQGLCWLLENLDVVRLDNGFQSTLSFACIELRVGIRQYTPVRAHISEVVLVLSAFYTIRCSIREHLSPLLCAMVQECGVAPDRIDEIRRLVFRLLDGTHGSTSRNILAMLRHVLEAVDIQLSSSNSNAAPDAAELVREIRLQAKQLCEAEDDEECSALLCDADMIEAQLDTWPSSTELGQTARPTSSHMLAADRVQAAAFSVSGTSTCGGITSIGVQTERSSLTSSCHASTQTVRMTRHDASDVDNVSSRRSSRRNSSFDTATGEGVADAVGLMRTSEESSDQRLSRASSGSHTDGAWPDKIVEDIPVEDVYALQRLDSEVCSLLADASVDSVNTSMRISLLWSSDRYTLNLSLSTPLGTVHTTKKILGCFVLDVEDSFISSKHRNHIESISARRAVPDGEYLASSRLYSDRGNHYCDKHNPTWQALFSFGSLHGFVRGTHGHVGESILLVKFVVRNGIPSIIEHGAGLQGNGAFFHISG